MDEVGLVILGDAAQEGYEFSFSRKKDVGKEGGRCGFSVGTGNCNR